jgi:DnaJ family protein C protein 9
MKGGKKDKLDLYSLLNINKTANRDEIKKAYKVLALKVHPDKNPDDKEASEKFQQLHSAYQILVDEEKRKLYDQTGEIDDSVEIDLEGTYEYYKQVYPTITEKDITDFTLKYRESEMEQEDLISFYEEYAGDMTYLLEVVPLSRNEDVGRFLSIFEDLFKKKVIKKNKKFTQTKGKIKLLSEDDGEEVEEERKKIDELSKQILAKKKTREGNSYLDNLST